MELISENQKKVILKLVKYVLKSNINVSVDVKNNGMTTFYYRNKNEILYHHYFYMHKSDWEQEYKICMVNMKHQIKLAKELEAIK